LGHDASTRLRPGDRAAAAGQAVMGGFVACGYSSLAAFIYFYFIAARRTT
jgi:hypothetical protein